MEMTTRRTEPKTGDETVCKKCGAKFFAPSVSRYCPACLLESGLLQQGESVPPEDEPVMAEFGDYQLLEEIGRGGQGIVYRARQKSLNRLVALKIIGLGHRASETHLKRFRREAEAAASLQHPRIIPIYEIGERDGACYFSMKLEEGGQLDQFQRRGAISLRRAAEIIASLAGTVHYAHERGILHRDIKPGNILLDAQGEPHLADFGLVRLVETESTVTRTMEVLGTPSYIAPEQASGQNEQVTSGTDVYGLGAVLYQLLTTHPPFAGGTTYETIRLVLETEPRNPRLWNPKIDRDLATISLKCLEKEPARRYRTALSLAEDLERWLKHEPIQARRTGVIARSRKWIRRNTTTAVLLAALTALAAIVAGLFLNREPAKPPAGIAVLPFENLDGDKTDAVLVDGLQDDILTRLAKVAGLKVISRTSVMRYRGVRDIRQIGNGLHVSHVLEGSVRKEGEKIHLNAQLIDTQTDQHVWAEEYDRDLRDVFAIQTDLAQQVANQLHVKPSASEKAAMEARPTSDPVAYNLYSEASSMIDQMAFESDNKGQEKKYFHVVELLEQAIARDPRFLLAYCRLGEAHVQIYFLEYDHTSSRLKLAKSAIDSALGLQPNSGEAHLALATYLYRCFLNYDAARDELDIARRSLPNSARIFEMSAYIDRRQNRWHDAVRDANDALELDPENTKIRHAVAITYCLLRDYTKVRQTLDRRSALHRNEDDPWKAATWDLILRADPSAMHRLAEEGSGDDYDVVVTRLRLALIEHDPAAAERALARLDTMGETTIDARSVGITRLSRPYLQGLVDRMKGDSAAANVAFQAARVQQENAVSLQPSNGPTLCVLGLIDAALGRKEDALREGQHALELTPTEKDSLDAADVVYYDAVICAWVGERDLAMKQLESSARMPGGVTYAEIRLDPEWDPLRTDPRFEKLAASLKP